MIPPPESRPIAGLELHRDGAECLVCHELMSDVRQMKKHCREHGWKTGQGCYLEEAVSSDLF